MLFFKEKKNFSVTTDSEYFILLNLERTTMLNMFPPRPSSPNIIIKTERKTENCKFNYVVRDVCSIISDLPLHNSHTPEWTGIVRSYSSRPRPKPTLTSSSSKIKKIGRKLREKQEGGGREAKDKRKSICLPYS